MHRERELRCYAGTLDHETKTGSGHRSPALLALRPRRVADTLFVFALVILPMVAFIALLFLVSSADPTTAVAGVVDGAGMLILPP